MSTSKRPTVPCSYDDCHRWFHTVKEMRYHKNAEPEHEYCYKCDVDCEDDSALLMHMIESCRHIVCPICGNEFKSNAGLESHIPQRHQTKQDLNCVGCKAKFTAAADLMRHIEQDNCSALSRATFERRRAEKAVAKDAWAKALSSDGSVVPRGTNQVFSDDTETNAPGGVSLLEQQQAWGDGPKAVGPKDEVKYHLTGQIDFLSLDENNQIVEQFPALGQARPLTAADLNVKYTPLTSANLNLQSNPLNSANMNHQGQIYTPPSNLIPESEDSSVPWGLRPNAASTLFPTSEAPLLKAVQNTNPENPALPTAAVPLSSDPNAHISAGFTPIRPTPLLDPMQCFNNMTNVFECPGRKCGKHFTSIEKFNAHLTSSTHVGGRTTCPSCLKKFINTQSLVAHCESPSKRCKIRHSANYDQVLREITGGLLGIQGHHTDGSVKYVANDINKPGYW